MTEVLDWCFTNWKLLVYIVCTLIILICTVFKKKVQILDSVKEVILQSLPEFINKVEEPGNGPAKLKAVIEMCVALISKLFPGVNANQYIPFIEKSVKAILKTPQSKG